MSSLKGEATTIYVYTEFFSILVSETFISATPAVKPLVNRPCYEMVPKDSVSVEFPYSP
jgi:hypothetical protein